MTDAILETSLTVSELEELKACEAIIDRGLQTYFEVGSALQQIRDNRLYRAEFATYEEYCQQRWGMTKTHANRLVGAAEVHENLTPIGVILPTNEAQARPLVGLPPDQQREAWQDAVTTSGGKPTAALAQAAAEKVKKHFYVGQRVAYAGRFYQIATLFNGVAKLRSLGDSETIPDIPVDDIYETLAESMAAQKAKQNAAPDKQPFDPVLNALTRAYHYAETLRDGWHTFPYGNYQSRELVESLIAIGLIEAAHYGKPDERLRITPAGCTRIDQPLVKWMLPDSVAPSALPIIQSLPPDPDSEDLPLSQSHPFFASLATGHATCAGCGDTDARWKAVSGGLWVHICGVKTADSEMQPFTKEDMDAEGRMDQRRNGRQKPKNNSSGEHAEGEPDPRDACQTPDYAVDPLLPFLKPEWTILEPACGEGLLIDALFDSGFETILKGDLLTGQDFLESISNEHWDCIVTNPPYSTKYDFLARCYSLGTPFALLMPIDVFGSKQAQALFAEHGIEVIFMNERTDFKMPKQGWDGAGAQFNTAWFTWQLNIGQAMTFADTTEAKKAFVDDLVATGQKRP